MLLIASILTVLMAIFLVWMDNALANQLEEQTQSMNAFSNPGTGQVIPAIQLPEVTIRPVPDKMITLNLPEVVIEARHCKGA